MDNAAPSDVDMPGLLPRFLPRDASDEQIAAAVAHAGVLPLLMTVIHVTGKLDILDVAGPTARPAHSTDMTGGLGRERTTAVRALAIEAIRVWRDAGCPAPYEPTDAELTRMIETLTGKALDERYQALITEELGFSGDERAFRWSGPVAADARSRMPVLVVGAGLSGLVMGYRLKQAGIPFTIIEKNDGPGGTWFENRYPGARVDVPSHCYSFSFTRDFPWPELFSPWPVLRRYFAEFAKRFGLSEFIRYKTEVTRAVYDEETAEWIVSLRSAEGEETQRVRAFVSAVGQLNRPLIPSIEGEELFQGVRTHTSRWPDGLSIKGKKIAVIGTAATALQLVPELAKEAARLTVFQRSPTWVFIHPEYRNHIAPEHQWAIDHLPGYARWYRVILYNWAGDGDPAHMRIDPAWTDEDSVSAANKAARERLTKAMSAVIGSDPDLLERMIPKYPPYVKRPNVGDGGFFQVFSLPHVQLCTDGVSRFTATGIVDGAGVEHEADIVVYATGFRALEYLAPMEIVGRGGVHIDQYWADEPRAYLGMTVPKFPNLFLMYGPGTNLGYNGNLFFNSECQARYITECVRWMVEEDIDAIEVKTDVYTDYARRMDEALSGFTWSHGSAGSWYKNKSGKVIANSPWPLVQYWDWTREPDYADYETVKAKQTVS